MNSRSRVSLWFRLLACLALACSLAPAQVPAPEEVFGFRPGADHRLADYPLIVKYFQRLAGAAPGRVRLVDIGRTAEGQTQFMAILSSEENLRRLERLRDISRRLAVARGLDEAAARELAAEGRAVVWIDSGLHASEVAPAQHAPELAWRVVTEESAEMRRVRDQVVLLLVPVMNPDGLNMIAGWYAKNVGTRHELADMPWLYHKYTGHDNNRDWYMMTQPETRNVARVLYHQWFPQIVYNHHQAGSVSPRIVVPPYAEPMNPNIPPLVIRGVHLVGDAIAQRFAREKKPGVVSRVSYDTWWNGGMRTAPYYHNMIGILTETALFRYASSKFYKPDDLPKTLPNGMPYTEPSTFNPNPWKGGWWRLRDAVEYEMTASLAVLDIAARLLEEWLMNSYHMGRAAIEAGEQEGPYAYVVPAQQWDVGAAAEMLKALRLGGVEVHRAAEAFKTGDGEFPAGSWVVLAAQPFRPYVIDLFEKQNYPEQRSASDGKPRRPYDITGWTLPLQMGVEVARLEKPFAARLEPVREPAVPPAPAPGGGAEAWVLSHRPNNFARAVNWLLKAGVRVSFAAEPFQQDGATFEAGSVVVEASAPASAVLARAAAELGMAASPLPSAPAVRLAALRAPRLGLYSSWVANMDEGWTRWVLEQFDFPYTTLRDADVGAGQLRDRFDAILLPHQGLDALLHGHRPVAVPENGRENGRESDRGDSEPRIQRPEYTGGLGLRGALELRQFVEEGGTLITLDSASSLPIQLFGIPVRNALAGVRSEDFYAPGSLLRLEVDTSHPLTWGMRPESIAFFVSSGAFEVAASPDVKAPARYAAKDVLASGWLVGERRIAGKGAVVEASLGQGKVVLIGFRAQFRAQPRNTFNLLFNAVFQSAAE